MQPFTLDQAIITGLLFLLGVLIGMFLLAGGKWKRRYVAEANRTAELERENERLAAEAREFESLRHAAARAPGTAATSPLNKGATRVGAPPVPRTADPYRRVDPGATGGDPDIVIRRT